MQSDDNNPDQTPETEPQAYGRGQCPRKAPGEYKALNEGLVATIALANNLESNYQLETPSGNFEPTYYLPPDFAFVGIMNLELNTLDEAL